MTSCRATVFFVFTLIFTCLFSACAISTHAPLVQSAAKTKVEKTDWDRGWWLLSERDQPLAGIALMEKSVASKHFPVQTLAQFYAFTGDEHGTNALIDKNAVPVESQFVDTKGYTQQPAIDAILSLARDKRVVILNESHTSQRQRAFAFELVMHLRKIGFTHFGAETFAAGIAENMRDGVPTFKTGVYTLDPIYADLVRQAAKLGYTLFDYEQRSDQRASVNTDRTARVNNREQAQTDNVKKWLDNNPNAKIFLYVGGNHGSKVPDEDGLEWMATRLVRTTGLDVLSIDQNAGTPRGQANLDGELYRGASNLGVPNFTFVLANNSGQLLSRPGYDIVIFHPRLPDAKGRPGWLTMNGYRKRHSLNIEPMSVPTLIRAFVKSERKRSTNPRLVCCI